MPRRKKCWFSLLCALLWVLLLVDFVESVALDGLSSGVTADKAKLLSITLAALLSTVPEELGYHDARTKRAPSFVDHICRKRRSVDSVMDELGPIYVRRAYRMDRSSFWKLCHVLKPELGENKRARRSHKQRKGAKNGRVPGPTRLSCGLRFFAGGRPEDISVVHGISHSAVCDSVWRIVDAVNRTQELNINFPTSHLEQRKLAHGFRKASQAGFDICVGAIDCMLTWIEKPTETSCRQARCGSKKFYCGRKSKFGLPLQAVCDADRRFLGVSLQHPASTSDFLAFTTSSAHGKLEQAGFLDWGKVLFGDLAHCNCRHVATPFKSAKSGTKDDYNFYHSQLRISVECVFGQLVARWGILRKALPATMGIAKASCLVMCLCKLHNFCVNERLSRADGLDIAEPTAEDSMEVDASGGIRFDENSDKEGPSEPLGGGHHFDDVTEAQCVAFTRRRLGNDVLLRDKLHMKVERGGFQRPIPRTWQDDS